MNIRSNALAALALFAALSALPVRAQETCPSPPAGPPLKTVHVSAPKATLVLRVASTFDARAYGLMCVRSLPANGGMLFVFSGGDRPQSFWMKDTLVPLDMVFVAKGGRVTSVASHVPATTVETPDERIPRREGVGSYVIELAAGEAARAGITAGTHLVLPAIPVAKE